MDESQKKDDVLYFNDLTAIVLSKKEKRLAKPLSIICKDFSLHLQWFYSRKKLQSITFDSN